MKKMLLLLLFVSTAIYGQQVKTPTIGQTNLRELQMKTYKGDSTANALVLFEKVHYYIPDLNELRFKSDYYRRIKIFNKDGLEYAVEKIFLKRGEELQNVSAVTYNLKDSVNIKETRFKKEDILVTEVSEGVYKHIINLPNVKEGSVIEYKYTVNRGNFNIDSWRFQSQIPKLKSEFSQILPSSIKYKVTLRGALKLSRDTTYFSDNCFVQNKYFKAKRCRNSIFSMDSIASFKEEPMMSNPENYISKLSFKLDYVLDIGYFPGSFLSTWKSFDKFHLALLSYNQKQHTKFFKRKIPDSIFAQEDKLTKAKSIYAFIQDHYNWDGYLGGGFSKSARKQFNKKTGSVMTINTSLFNSLKAANIPCYYVLVSTRGNGIPVKDFPEGDSFNYIIVKTVIGNQEYFLDATDKILPFGMVSKRCLNGEARVLNNEGVGYWQVIKPSIANSKSYRVVLDLNEDDSFSGKLSLIKKGYNAAIQRELFKAVGEKKYIESFEEEFPEMELSNFEIKNLEHIDRSVNESFSLNIDEDYIDTDISDSNVIRFNPVMFDRATENPFKTETRLYPLDFVHNDKSTFLLRINLPKNYSVKKLPEPVAIKLPENGGLYVYKVVQKGNVINVVVRYRIDRKFFSKNEYFYLKEFYNKIVQAENSYIELEKK